MPKLLIFTFLSCFLVVFSFLGENKLHAQNTFTPKLSSENRISALVTAPLNLRSGPGIKYHRITLIPLHSKINVRTCSQNWCQVTYGEYLGWSSVRYLAFLNSNDLYKSYQIDENE
ncbi:SH3 domain-containing protein [Bartonella tamiae]|uniref:SH3b domain-containing protein n=1 Tax=Bartonella tamiae Th239 TaxID=1094558 RepID=J0R0W2_9HYPH|nr:SH3 domain-containing protein [Bartonella tamiae]EJF89174.1 hypothetical protein ME5_01725 [Bartonella tamiae Th239]EJF95423.1 hypothetical protein MEG_00156 [Bartonella tamiae Th307]